jgi:adiponectin receptor
MGVLYLTGAIIYGARVPERWWPGRFDLFLHSHQIFHVIVLAASMSHYYGMVRAFHWHHTANPFCAITNFMP